jgi:hypothetical protein
MLAYSTVFCVPVCIRVRSDLNLFGFEIQIRIGTEDPDSIKLQYFCFSVEILKFLLRKSLDP